MHFSVLAAVYSLLTIGVNASPDPLSDLARKRFCHNDACQKALLSPNVKKYKHASQDCKRFFKTTITPDPVTVTTTITDISITATATEASVTTTSTDVINLATTTTTVVTVSDGALRRRKTSPTSSTVPPYASACSDTSAYSSACRCLGATATTKTLPTETVTETQRVVENVITTTTEDRTSTIATKTTTTSVETATATCDPSNFLLRIVSPGNGFDGNYFAIAPTGYSNEFTLNDVGSVSDATPFYLRSTDLFWKQPGSGTTFTADIPRGTDWYPIFFDTAETQASYPLVKLACSKAGGKLSCNAGSPNRFFKCSTGPSLSISTGPNGYCDSSSEFTLDVVPTIPCAA